MRGRFFFAVLAATSVAGCPDGGAGPDGEPSGQLTVAFLDPRERLVDAPALVRFCPTDSALTLVTPEGRWIAALALRTAWPPALRYAVDSTLGGIGSAAFAVRPLEDSVGVALIARAGTVELDSGPTLSGRFDVEARRDTSVVRLSGRFEGMRPDTNACATP